MERIYVRIACTGKIRAEWGKGALRDAMKELFIRYYNVREKKEYLFKRRIIEIYWGDCSTVPLTALSSAVLFPSGTSCTQKLCTHCFSFHTPGMLRSFQPWLVSQYHHLHLTASKAVIVVNIAFRVFCLSFLSVETRCKKGLFTVFLGYCCCGCRMKSSILPLRHQAMQIPASMWKAGSGRTKPVSSRTCRSEKS